MKSQVTGLVLFCVLASATVAEAQLVLHRPVPPPAPGAAASSTDEAPPAGQMIQGENADSAPSPLLPQAGLAVGRDGSTVSLSAFEFFTSATTKFYLRSTLPVTSGGQSAASGEPSDALRSGILDPFGGLLNASMGVYRHRTGRFGRALALDARAGIKLLETPDAAAQADGQDRFETNPFLTSMAMLKLDLPLFNRPTLKPADRAGHLVVAIGGNFTFAGSAEYLEALPDLDRAIFNLTVGVAIDLPSVFYITLEGTPWSSDSSLGSRFVVSVNALRKD